MKLFSFHSQINGSDKSEAFHQRMDDFERRLRHLSDVVEVIQRKIDEPPDDDMRGRTLEPG